MMDGVRVIEERCHNESSSSSPGVVGVELRQRMRVHDQVCVVQGLSGRDFGFAQPGMSPGRNQANLVKKMYTQGGKMHTESESEEMYTQDAHAYTHGC